METNSSNPTNKELEQSLKKMMISSSPTKFSAATVVLMLIILASILFSNTLKSDDEHFQLEIDLRNVKSGDITHDIDLKWCSLGTEAYVYLGEKEEFFDNHAAIRNSFDPEQISTFSFLSAKSYDCGPIQTFGDIANFFNVKIEDFVGKEKFKTSNNVTLEFSSVDPNTKAYPCGFRALTIRSIPFQLLDDTPVTVEEPEANIVKLQTDNLTWNSDMKIFKEPNKVNWVRASHSHILNSLRTSPLGYGVKFMGTFKCGANNKYKLRIPEEFILSNSKYPIYNLIEFHVRSVNTLNKAPFSYLIFSLINVVIIALVMACILCKKDKFFINPKMR